VDKEKVSEVTKALDKLEEKLLTRLPRAADRSPDTFSEEIEAPNEVLELKTKLALAQKLEPLLYLGHRRSGRGCPHPADNGDIDAARGVMNTRNSLSEVCD